MYRRHYKPSRAKAKAFSETMTEIEKFCTENGISASASRDSYYFTLGEQRYRVSNHTIAASNRGRFDADGNERRAKYHGEGDKDLVCITAGKTRIIEIYNDIKNGYALDGRGNRKN